MERKYISANGVVERTRYAVGDNAKPRRGKRRGTSSFRKQEQNFNSALRRLSRILNCNYCHENGMLITLDYDETGLERIIGSLQEEDRETIREMRAPVGKIGTWRAKGKGTARDCHDQCAHWSRNDKEGSQNVSRNPSPWHGMGDRLRDTGRFLYPASGCGSCFRIGSRSFM